MNLTKASNQQLKNIIEWDEHCPTLLLYQIYEEAIKRDLYKYFIGGCLIKYFGTIQKAEIATKLSDDELKWYCYQKGFEALEKFEPGILPFTGLWGKYIKFAIRDLARDHRAQKRSAEIVDIDHVGHWVLPPANHNTEKTALNRIHIESLMDRLRDYEKEIVLKRFEGYTLLEIANMQGVTKTGIQRRIQLYVKRLKESDLSELAEII
ncbi:hypothetical protein [Bacillus sp. JJ1474]|uniref:hypothetical protein n=1 Tax=Bacillus sp. JJ1474 TaxID=3122955 RepID=UPI002FFE9530